MNLLLVGAGGHAFSWKQNVDRHPDWKIVAIVDTDTEKLDHVNSWGVSEDEAYPTIDDAMKWTDYELDAALITSPIPTHHLLATEALENGLHVILEKNMACTIKQGQELVRLARTYPELCTVMGTQYRHRPTWWTLKNLFQSQSSPIGDVSHFRMKSSANSGSVRRGWRAFMSHIYPSDMMVHHIDSLRYALDMDVVQVQAKVFKPSWSRWLGTSTVYMNMVMAPQGKENDKDTWVYGQYLGDWQSTGLKNDWEDQIEFFCKRGSIRFEPPENKVKKGAWMDMWEEINGVKLIGEPLGSKLYSYLDQEDGKTVHKKEVEKRIDIENNPASYLDQVYILDELASCIRSKGKIQPQTNFEDAFKSYLVTRAAILSSDTGKTIWLPDYYI